MKNILKNSSNPSGYDSRYQGSYPHKSSQSVSENIFINAQIINPEINEKINAEIEKQVERIKQYIQQTQTDTKPKHEERLITEYVESLSEISQLKVTYIVKIIKRKLAVLHRVRNHRLLKDKKIPDSLIIEREIEKRATLNIVDMLAILKFADKNKDMSTQQKVLLMNELNKNVKLMVDEKIAIVNRIIKANIVTDIDSCKHLKNKLALLFIVKESGFSIDVTKVKGFKPVMNEVEEAEIENNQPTEEKLVTEVTADDNATEEESTSHLNEVAESDDKYSTDDITEVDELPDIQFAQPTATEKSEKTTKAKAKSKIKSKVKSQKSVKKPQVTKTFVNSKRHFKFGAGYIAKNSTLTLLLPSGYILDETNAYQSSALRNNMVSKTDISSSPLRIMFAKTAKSTDYSLVDFYNSNLIECRDNSLKYRNTVISRSPAVLKHKPNSNIYTVSVFIREKNLVYDINFTFKKTVANTASTVNRILASILFEGM